MSNAPLLYALAAVSTSFAGFAGLYLALRPHDAAWEEYEARHSLAACASADGVSRAYDRRRLVDELIVVR